MWTLFQNKELTHWPRPSIERSCHSAPPVGLCSPPDPERRNARKLYATIHKSTAIAPTPSLYNVFEQNSEENFSTTNVSKSGELSEGLTKHLFIDNIDSEGLIEENSTQILANFIPTSLNHSTTTNSVAAAATLRALNVTSSSRSSLSGCLITDLKVPQITGLINSNVAINMNSFEGIPISENTKNENNVSIENNNLFAQTTQQNLSTEQFFENPAVLITAANKNITFVTSNNGKFFLK